MATIPAISPTRTGFEPPPIGANGGADPPPINDGNQSRHTQGGGGCGSSLQDVAVMVAAMNNNEGVCLYASH
jgi:hypothetical protein